MDVSVVANPWAKPGSQWRLREDTETTSFAHFERQGSIDASPAGDDRHVPTITSAGCVKPPVLSEQPDGWLVSTQLPITLLVAHLFAPL